MQKLAEETQLQDGAQLFILEDTTGAGKTEAAIMLAARMMAKGKGEACTLRCQLWRRPTLYMSGWQGLTKRSATGRAIWTFWRKLYFIATCIPPRNEGKCP